MANQRASFDQTVNEKRQKYRDRLDVIRNPELNHMSRTKTKKDFVFNRNKDGQVGPRKKKKAYDGAYVAEPRRQKPSGFALLGQMMSHIHNFVIDMDLTSLYPSIMLICNLSPKTMVAKVFFKDKIDIPMYDFIRFIDRDEKHDYRCNANDFFMETYVGRHWWAIGEIYLKLPTTERILDYIEDHINEFV